ncbi:hypothetical protein K6119_00490 [Paracrocinitomix mangrovi]|uniref:hypothetical protein n=1 Tax=Paracrocinitomix mangrovi TaxID=2862509 RepID=UPI001C8DB570|nr:hypothetical protein [Paracrocinitomix mangrovi]UKN01992.1 hypothetical protein K6119_00490 [Paracrocinitomix mangrovi]
MKSLLSILFALLTFIGFSTKQGNIPTVQEGIKQSDHVFTARIISVDTIQLIDSVQIRDKINGIDVIRERGKPTLQIAHYKLVVNEVFKGNLKKDTIDLYTDNQVSNCGFRFILNQDYIVYATNFNMQLLDAGVADYYPKLNKAVIWTNCNSRTRKRSQSEIKRIKANL